MSYTVEWVASAEDHLSDENTFTIEPLAVDYFVFEDPKRVLVLKVWMIGYLADHN